MPLKNAADAHWPGSRTLRTSVRSRSTPELPEPVISWVTSTSAPSGARMVRKWTFRAPLVLE